MFQPHFLVSINWEVNHKKFLIASLGDVEGTVTCFEGDQSTEKQGMTGMVVLLDS